jgi:hypothetical protein
MPEIARAMAAIKLFKVGPLSCNRPSNRRHQAWLTMKVARERNTDVLSRHALQHACSD